MFKFFKNLFCKFKCGECGISKVRLYRPYGNFYRPEDNRCNSHITDQERGWYVPLCPDKDGNPWGYTSVPQDVLDEFYALPEADPKYYTWDQRSSDRIYREDPNDPWSLP